MLLFPGGGVDFRAGCCQQRWIHWAPQCVGGVDDWGGEP
jgi:hypothetical protein